jgi:hypothetical protein
LKKLFFKIYKFYKLLKSYHSWSFSSSSVAGFSYLSSCSSHSSPFSSPLSASSSLDFTSYAGSCVYFFIIYEFFRGESRLFILLLLVLGIKSYFYMCLLSLLYCDWCFVIMFLDIPDGFLELIIYKKGTRVHINESFG